MSQTMYSLPNLVEKNIAMINHPVKKRDNREEKMKNKVTK